MEFSKYKKIYTGVVMAAGISFWPWPWNPSVPPVPTRVPIACPQVYAPVCGINGKTYGNRCEAEKQAFVPVLHDGPCGRPFTTPTITPAPTACPTPFPQEIQRAPVFFDNPFPAPLFTPEPLPLMELKPAPAPPQPDRPHFWIY